MTTNECTWTQADHYDYCYWETSCKQIFEFEEGGPHSNEFKFCPYCGKPLHEVVPDPDIDEDDEAFPMPDA